MSAKDIYEGLGIQLKYCPNELCYAEHDIFYGPCDDEVKLSDEDKEKLINLGWFIDENTWAIYT